MHVLDLLAAGAAAALLAGAAGAAQAAVIYPVSAAASSGFPTYEAANAIDQGPGAALSDWASFRQGVGSFLNLDLGAVYVLDQADVTDRVTSGGGNNAFVGGLFDFTTRFSLQAFADAGFATALAPALVFDHSAAGPHTSPADFLLVAPLGGLTARYLQYTVLTTNGVNPGLSDIHFETASVLEPAGWSLLLAGFAGLGATLRRARKDEECSPEAASAAIGRA
jgi:hypothetical protein